MEGNLSSGNMISSGGSYGGLDLQGSMRAHHHHHHQQQQHRPFSLHQQQQQHTLPRQGSIVHPSIHEGLPLTMGTMHVCNQNTSLAADYPKGERGKNSASDEDEFSFNDDTNDGYNDTNRGKKSSSSSLWHRVKWTDTMVRLLITAVSYIGGDSSAERRKNANLQKKGKWKSVSKVMAERGHCVSPQQCEDKFNDLNKRYKRLNEILGRGTSCEVVEHPELLDVMDHISEKAKEEVRKILSSKHLFYEEMCSYHNGNRLHLPHDPELQRSLRLALRTRDDNDNSDVRRQPIDDLEEEDQDAETDDMDELEEDHGSSLHGKRRKQCDNLFGNSLNLVEFGDVNQIPKEWIKQRSLQLEEQMLQIQARGLELERERFKWERFCRKRDRDMEMMRMENERMKLENERMALELKQKELEAKEEDGCQ